jgi:hypothetical protein
VVAGAVVAGVVVAGVVAGAVGAGVLEGTAVVGGEVAGALGGGAVVVGDVARSLPHARSAAVRPSTAPSRRARRSKVVMTSSHSCAAPAVRVERPGSRPNDLDEFDDRPGVAIRRWVTVGRDEG